MTSPKESFAERVAELEALFAQLPNSAYAATTRELLAAVRDQQAALKKLLPHIYTAFDGRGHDAAEQARACLAKYEVKP